MYMIDDPQKTFYFICQLHPLSLYMTNLAKIESEHDLCTKQQELRTRE